MYVHDIVSLSPKTRLTWSSASAKMYVHVCIVLSCLVLYCRTVVCNCMYIRVHRERERERERESESGREREREKSMAMHLERDKDHISCFPFYVCQNPSPANAASRLFRP